MAKAQTNGRPLAAAFIPLPDYRPPRTAQAKAHTEPASWYAIRNAAAPDEAELLLYDEIGGWFGTWADEFLEDLKAITAPNLRVRVNSPGGSVFEGVALANALRAHPANVIVQVDGIAASIASVIAMAGDRVVMGRQSTLMIHDASGMCMGDAAEMTKMAEVLDLLSDNIADAYAEKAGGSRAEWRARMREETWYLADEAVAAGLADEVLPARQRNDDDPMNRQWDLSGFRYAGREQAPAPAASAAPQPDSARPAVESEAHDVTADVDEQKPCTVTLTFKPGDNMDADLAALLRNIATGNRPEPEATAAPKHSTETTEGEWDGPAQEKKLPSPVPVATAKKVYAWYDASQVEDGKVPKSACKLPHHTVSSDGTPGAAVMAGVRNALSRLPQTHGIPESEKSAVEAHLRKHLTDGGSDPDDHTADPTTAAQPDEQAPDGWADQTAHLYADDGDAWAQLVAQLTTDDPLTPSSSAATA